MPATETLHQPNDTLERADLLHTICCEDPNGKTFCGLDAAGMGWDGPDPPCVVCDKLDESGFCPRHGQCPEWDDE